MAKRRKTATVEDLDSWDPCWDKRRIADLLRGVRRKRWNWDAVCELRGVEGLPDADWLWVAYKFLGHCGQSKTLRLFACDCASRVLRQEHKAGREPAKGNYAAVRVVRRYARGQATDAQLADARNVAWDACNYVAFYAADANDCWAAYNASTRATSRSSDIEAEEAWRCKGLVEVAAKEWVA